MNENVLKEEEQEVVLDTVDTADNVPDNDKNGEIPNEIIENGDGYDSLICLPAPPTIDEIKQLNDITLLENNNMDSLPPPPPPEVIVEGPTNGES